MTNQMNGWYLDLMGTPRYVTMDAAAFAETVAGLLQASLPFNAGQEFGIFSIQLLMPPPMTDSHEALAKAAKPNTQCLWGVPGCKCWTEASQACSCKGTGLANYAAVPYEEYDGAARTPLKGNDRVTEYYRQTMTPEPEPQELDLENTIARATAILARGLADVWRSVATGAADLADQMTQMADIADLERQLMAIQTEPDSDTPEGYKLWAGRCKEALAHDRRPRSTQWVCGDINCDGCYEPNPPALVDAPDELTLVRLFLWRTP